MPRRRGAAWPRGVGRLDADGPGDARAALVRRPSRRDPSLLPHLRRAPVHAERRVRPERALRTRRRGQDQQPYRCRGRLESSRGARARPARAASHGEGGAHHWRALTRKPIERTDVARWSAMIDSGPPGTSVDNWAYPPQPPSWPSLPPTPPKRPSRTLPIAAAIGITILVGAAGGIAVA